VEQKELEIYTIGHSTRSIEQFLEILQAHGIGLVADVRTIPRSGRNPQFNAEALAASLSRETIDYVHLAGLGGFRRPKADSRNTAWENESFRGYADYMQTAEFTANLEKVMALAMKRKTALMCAEAVPWRCHRMLIADALTARGVVVRHLIDRAEAIEHKLTPSARVEGEEVTYPREAVQE
jgi:uncharacterized protein (DUF488 family)